MLTAKVSAKGWVVIPAEMRERYNIKPGDEVALVDYGGVISILPLPDDPVEAGWGLLAGADSLTEAIVEEHRREREREDAR